MVGVDVVEECVYVIVGWVCDDVLWCVDLYEVVVFYDCDVVVDV